VLRCLVSLILCKDEASSDLDVMQLLACSATRLRRKGFLIALPCFVQLVGMLVGVQTPCTDHS